MRGINHQEEVWPADQSICSSYLWNKMKNSINSFSFSFPDAPPGLFVIDVYLRCPLKVKWKAIVTGMYAYLCRFLLVCHWLIWHLFFIFWRCCGWFDDGFDGAWLWVMSSSCSSVFRLLWGHHIRALVLGPIIWFSAGVGLFLAEAEVRSWILFSSFPLCPVLSIAFCLSCTSPAHLREFSSLSRISFRPCLFFQFQKKEFPPTAKPTNKRLAAEREISFLFWGKDIQSICYWVDREGY